MKQLPRQLYTLLFNNTDLCNCAFSRTLRYVMFAYWHRSFVRRLCLLSVTFVHPIQRVEFFCNIVTPKCILATWLGCEENSEKT